MKENDELKKISENTNEFSQIEIRDGKNSSQTIYFSGKPEGNVERESYSMPPVPPAGGFDARLEDDYRLTKNDEATIKIQTNEYPVRIKITNLKNGAEYKLVEISNGQETASHRIVNGEEIIISDETVNKLRIAVVFQFAGSRFSWRWGVRGLCAARGKFFLHRDVGYE